MQFTFSVLRTIFTIDFVRCHQQLESGALQPSYMRSVGLYDHTLDDVFSACSYRCVSSIDLDEAEAAAGMRRHIPYGAEVGDIDTGVQRGEEKLLAFRCLRRLSVDDYI